VVGQVTRVFPFSSEVTLLTDKDQAIPVQVLRSGLRSVAYGGGQSGLLDLRFMASNADIQNGDMLVTSGIDGVYPAGLAVAKVTRIESKSTDAFAHILCQPAAGVDRNRQLLILLSEAKVAPRLPPEETRDHKEKGTKKKTGAPAVKAVPAAGATAPGATDSKAAAAPAAPGAKPAVAAPAAQGVKLPAAADMKRGTASAPAATPAPAAASPKPSPKGADR
jgi:rod shape-determining protein MreC